MRTLTRHDPAARTRVQAVVFLTFWQGLFLAVISAFSEAVDGGGGGGERDHKSLQNFLICVEMFLASLAHAYVYGHQEWEPGWLPPQEHVYFSDNVAIGDFISDFKDVATGGAYDTDAP